MATRIDLTLKKRPERAEPAGDYAKSADRFDEFSANHDRVTCHTGLCARKWVHARGRRHMAQSRVFTSTDPDAYLTTIRASNAAILTSDRGEFRAGLTSVAFDRLWMQWGFDSLLRIAGSTLDPDRTIMELGRFSVEYRGLFGESPSESLRRPGRKAGIVPRVARVGVD